MLDVVYAREPNVEQVEKVILVRRQILHREDLEQVAEVVAAVIISTDA